MEKRLKRARRSPPVSSLALRSLRMTSGLFNTGSAGDSTESTSSDFASIAAATQPGPSTCSMWTDKHVCSHDEFLAKALEDTDDFNMEDMFGNLGGAASAGDFDPLGDASLDSFMDLTAFLSEDNAFLDPSQVEEAAPMPDLGQNAKPSTTTSLKRSFAEMESGSTSTIDLNTLSGLTTSAAIGSPNLDHDYSSKRPRMSSPVTEKPASEEVFLCPAPPAPAPTPSATPSTSYEKSRHRREKNNVASKRSRQVRKQKFADMELEAEHLIVENARLEKRVGELEDLAKRMKEILVAKMAGK